METQTRVAKMIEMIANVAIIVSAVLFSGVLIKSYLGPTNTEPRDPAANPPPPITEKILQKGDVLQVSNLNLPKSGRTLLLALSTTCRFCTESAPFYQKISNNDDDTRLVAVFPQSKRDGEQYLQQLGVKVDEVRQVSFTQLGITGTPTLVLVDADDKVTNKWEGALSPERESEVLNRLKEDIAKNR
jgi:Thioredoxin-like domain